MAIQTPMGLVAMTKGVDTIQLFWDFNPNTDYFDLYRSEDESGTFLRIAQNIVDVGALDINLDSETEYFYKLKAISTEDGESDFSEIVSAITQKDNQLIGKNFYYPKTIRGVIVSLMDMFNDLTVERYDKVGNLIKTIPVPLLFAPQEKSHQKRTRDASDNPGSWDSTPLPRLGIAFTGLNYDSDRAVSTKEIRNFYDVNLGLNDSYTTDFQPTPYNFTFSLYLRTDSITDFSQIMENILPYFNPTLYLRVKEFSFLNIERDLPVNLEGVSTDFLESMDNENERYVNGNIDITVKGFFYRPISATKVIKTIDTRFIITQPGKDPLTTSSYNISGTFSDPITGDITNTTEL